MTTTPRLVVAIVLLFAAFPLVPRPVVVAIALATNALTIVAWRQRAVAAVHVGLFATLCFAMLATGVVLSQLWLGVAIIAYATVVQSVSWLRGTAEWARWGDFGRHQLLLCLVCAAVAGASLLVWFVALRPNVDDILATFFPDVSPWLLLIGAVGFSMVNAAVEEIAYRGVIMFALRSALGAGAVALGLQAVAFGTLHINGFPRGTVGVGLAIIYGLMMGLVREHAGGMLAPWFAHVMTDLTIVTILVLLA